nr:olfactory receptor 52E4-like [Pelodiscus sinensis]|eukprot:XP_025035937.1 olfactory receptor 52E4-like [Pelodiscus sinensis]
MSDFNSTKVTNPSTFILQGIPGLETAHVWIAIPFCTMYIITILGNFTILFIVKTEPSLHEPMYYFLCMLAMTDLGLSTSIVPKALSIFWFNSREINFSACLTQMFFIHCFITIESGILVAMAVDRYVAICHPLRHSTILTNATVTKIALAMVLRGALITLPFDSVFHIPGLYFSLSGRFEEKKPHPVQVLIANMYYVMPPMLNPIIYGVMTKQIRNQMLHFFVYKGA